MKRKIALLLVLVLAFSAALVSCGKKCKDHGDADMDGLCENCGKTVTARIGLEGVYVSEVEPSGKKPYSQAESLSALDGMIMQNSGGELYAYSYNYVIPEAGDIKYAVLNSKTGEVVYKLIKEASGAKVTATAAFQSCYNNNGGYTYFIRETKTDRTNESDIVYTQTLYSALGEKITSKTSNESFNISFISATPDSEGALFAIEDKVYESKNGVFTYKCDKGFKKIPTNLSYATDNNYYKFNSDEIFVYDANFNWVAYYTVPAGYEIKEKFLLADGNVLIQCSKLLPADASDYNLVMDGEKYDYKTLIFNIADQTTKNVGCNYIIEGVYNMTANPEMFEEYFVADALHNVAIVYPIVDKYVDENNQVFADFDNNMSMLGLLGHEITAQEGIVEPIGNNRFIAYNKAGQKFLINEKAEVIGEVSSATYNRDLKLFKLGDKHYDLDLKIVYDDITAIDYDFVGSGNGYTLYRETEQVDGDDVNTYYILNGITIKELDLPENLSYVNTYSNYFYFDYSVQVEGEGTKYYTDIYNTQGEKIFTVDKNVENYYTYSINEYGNVMLICVQIGNDYYTRDYQYYAAK